MPTVSQLSPEARAECFGRLPYGGVKRMAHKHGLNLNSLTSVRWEARREIALPPAGHRGWSRRQKALVVAALDRGAITESEVLVRYAMSPEELAAWRAGFASAGIEGLRVTKRRPA